MEQPSSPEPVCKATYPVQDGIYHVPSPGGFATRDSRVEVMRVSVENGDRLSDSQKLVELRGKQASLLREIQTRTPRKNLQAVGLAPTFGSRATPPVHAFHRAADVVTAAGKPEVQVQTQAAGAHESPHQVGAVLSCLNRLTVGWLIALVRTCTRIFDSFSGQAMAVDGSVAELMSFLLSSDSRSGTFAVCRRTGVDLPLASGDEASAGAMRTRLDWPEPLVPSEQITLLEVVNAYVAEHDALPASALDLAPYYT